MAHSVYDVISVDSDDFGYVINAADLLCIHVYECN